MGSTRRFGAMGWSAAVLLLLATAGARAQVTPFEALIVSEAGDYIGSGDTYHFIAANPADAQQVLGTNNSIDLRWTLNGFWSFNFVGPGNTRLQAGSYEDAERWPFQGPGHPGLSISGQGNGCNRLTGHFDVWDVSYAPDGRVERLAIDAVQYCETSARALRLYLRYGNTTVPLRVPRTAAAAGADQVVLPGTPVTLNGTQSTAQEGGALSYAWTQVAGPPVALAGASSASPTFTAPALAASEWHALQWQLEVEDSQGRRATDRVTVIVSENTAPRSEIRIDSDANDSLGQGRDVQQLIDPTRLTLDRNHAGGIALRYRFQAPSQDELGLQLAAPGRADITIGHYKLAYRYPFSVPSGKAGLDVTYGLGCSQSVGRFVVHDVAYDESGHVERLAVDFQQSCTFRGTDEIPLLGYIRINSVVPITSRAPTANAGMDLLVEPGDGVRLDATRSQGGATPVVAYSWTQLSGPAVQLAGAGSGAPQFLAPAAPPGGVTLEFRVTVTNGAGNSSADIVRVHVLGSDEARSYIYLEPTGFDFVTFGETLWLDENTGAFTITRYETSGRETVRVSFNDITFSDITLDSPQGELLAPGVYAYADTHDETKAGADPASDGRACNQSIGSLTLHEIERDSSGAVISLAADFTYTCDYLALTYGVLRFNSTVPFVAPTLIASAGAEQLAVGGDVVQLDSRISHPGTGSITGWSWRQLTGPAVTLSSQNHERVSFAAPDAGGVFEFEVTVTTSDGQTDSSTVRINVDPAGTRRSLMVLEPDPGEPVTVGVPLRFHMPVNEPMSWSTDPNYVHLTVFQHDVSLRLWAAGQEPLSIGSYEGTRIFGSGQRQSTTFPGLSFSLNGSGCAIPLGRFTIRELVRGNGGVLTSLAVDFQQVCDPVNGFLRGAFRFNSNVPVGESTPLASAGPDLTVLAGEAIRLDGRASTGQVAGNTTYRWRQLTGPTATFSGTADSALAFADAPQVSGVTLATFALTVTNALGSSAMDEMTVRILGAGEPATGLNVSRYDPTTARATHAWTADPNNSTPYVLFGSQSMAVNFASPSPLSTDFHLDTPTEKFSPGVYAVGAGDFQVEFRSGIDAICPLNSGVIRIHRVVYEGDTLRSMAYDFDIACGTQWGYTGAVRYNAPERVEVGRVYADAGSDAVVNEGATVSLNSTRSLIVAVPVYTNTWSQIAGPAVTLTEASKGRVSFVAPQVSTATTLQFKVGIADRSGQYLGEDTVSVTVNDTTPPPPPPPPPPPASGGGGASAGGGGGGGSLDILTAFLLLSLLLLGARRVDRRSPHSKARNGAGSVNYFPPA